MLEIQTPHGPILLDDEDQHIIEGAKVRIRLSSKNHRPTRYKAVTVWRSKWKAPQVLARLIMDPPEGLVIDHINGNTLDNRRENLRVCTIQQNNAARRPITSREGRVTNEWGYKGIVRYKASKKNPDAPDNYYWRAAVGSDMTKKVHAGSSKSPHRSALLYNRTAIDLYGEFSYLNDVPCHSDTPQPRQDRCVTCNAVCDCCCVCHLPKAGQRGKGRRASKP